MSGKKKFRNHHVNIAGREGHKQMQHARTLVTTFSQHTFWLLGLAFPGTFAEQDSARL